MFTDVFGVKSIVKQIGQYFHLLFQYFYGDIYLGNSQEIYIQ